MKKLHFILFAILAFSLNAQDTETINIDWDFGSNPTEAEEGDSNFSDRTVEVGDTVVWTWTNPGAVTHTVTSITGSMEVFDSGGVSGQGSTFAYTFMEIGTNPYQCNPHPGSMNGTITVVAEGTLSTAAFTDEADFGILPNPSANNLNINLSRFEDELNIDVFDILGKRVHKGVINQLSLSVNVTHWKSGVYFVRVYNGKSIQTKRFIKQ